jgi:hypothetical protein
MAFDPVAAARNEASRRRAVAALEAVLAAAGDAGREGVIRAGHVLHEEIVLMLSKPGSGRIYRRPGRIHQASAPGEPPAPDTGRYRASWSTRATGTDTRVEVVVGTSDKRGPWLEYGTRHMAPRPHLRPAVLSVIPRIGRMVAERIVAREKGAARMAGGHDL